MDLLGIHGEGEGEGKGMNPENKRFQIRRAGQQAKSFKCITPDTFEESEAYLNDKLTHIGTNRYSIFVTLFGKNLRGSFVHNYDENSCIAHGSEIINYKLLF